MLTQCIRDELVKIDPEHKAGYEKRSADYVAKLQKLGDDGKKALADKKDRNIVAFHDSLQYFARTFDLKVVASIEGMAGQEPDPGRFKELLKACQRDKVRVIAVESGKTYRYQVTAFDRAGNESPRSAPTEVAAQ